MNAKLRSTLDILRVEAQKIYAYNLTSPYAKKEAQGIIRAVKAIEESVQEAEDTLQSDFGTRLRQIRVERDMTQFDFANLLGHSLRTEQEYETNRRDPGIKRAQEIAEQLSVPWLWLIGYGDTFPWGNPHGDSED